MTSTNIPGIHSRSNLYYSVLPEAFRLPPCHGGELRGLCQLSLYLIAHQYSLGARHLHAFEAALRRPRSVLQYGAVGLQIAILLQKADPVFSRDLWCLSDLPTQGLLARNRCDARGAFPPLALRRRRYSRS